MEELAGEREAFFIAERGDFLGERQPATEHAEQILGLIGEFEIMGAFDRRRNFRIGAHTEMIDGVKPRRKAALQIPTLGQSAGPGYGVHPFPEGGA